MILNITTSKCFLYSWYHLFDFYLDRYYNNVFKYHWYMIWTHKTQAFISKIKLSKKLEACRLSMEFRIFECTKNMCLLFYNGHFYITSTIICKSVCGTALQILQKVFFAENWLKFQNRTFKHEQKNSIMQSNDLCDILMHSFKVLRFLETSAQHMWTVMHVLM